MSSQRRDDWFQPSFTPNGSTAHGTLPPLHKNSGSSGNMKPHQAGTFGARVPSRNPLPAQNLANQINGPPRRNIPRRVSFSKVNQDDTQPPRRSPKGQTYPRGCLQRRATSTSPPIPPRASRRFSASCPNTKVNCPSPPTQGKANHQVPNFPGCEPKPKLEIQDWISNTSERIALDAGMPPRSISISALDPVFDQHDEDDDTACGFDFIFQITQASRPQNQHQVSGGSAFQGKGQAQEQAQAQAQAQAQPQGQGYNPNEGIFTQIMRIIALALLQEAEDPYELHARQRAERRMERQLSGGEEKRRGKKRSSPEWLDISVEALFVVCIALCVVGVVVMFAMDLANLVGAVVG